MNAQAKTINLLLYDGSLNGVISIEDSNWNSGELYSAPRESVADLLKTDACNKYGVYLLLSSDMVYVGQSSDLAKRLTQHTIGKDWWQSAVILTTKDDSLNRSDVDFLENILIEKAQKLQKLDCDNKKKGNPPKVDKFRKVVLEQYLTEALFLMQLIGINVFSENKNPGSKKQVSTNKKALIDTVGATYKLALGKRVKAEAIQFVKDNGVKLEKTINYAVLHLEKKNYWLNPKVSCLTKDWNLILNDTQKNELLVLRIPGGTFSIKSGKRKGLKARNDRPDVIELKIAVDSLVDTVSKTDFSKYIVTTIKY